MEPVFHEAPKEKLQRLTAVEPDSAMILRERAVARELLVGDFQMGFAGFLDECDQGFDNVTHGELSHEMPLGQPEPCISDGTVARATISALTL